MMDDNDLLIIPDEPRIVRVSHPSGWRSPRMLGDPQATAWTPSGPRAMGGAEAAADRRRFSAEDRTGEQPVLPGEEGCPTLRGGVARLADDDCGRCGRPVSTCTCDFGV